MASERTSEEPQASSSSPGGMLLKGTSVSPGLVLGAAHRKDYDLARAVPERVPREGLELELNRFRQALEDSRRQLVDLRGRLEGQVKEDDARILDTHLTYLRDSVFIADVEGLILGEQMRLEAAISKVVSDFDRIFRLVENETLRQSAVDLRDVGIRVLRNLEARDPDSEDASAPEEYILVARELSIVDMFNLANEKVLGIVTEEGGLTSHAAIFARSMRIPTVTGIDDLRLHVRENDFVILDASEGVLRVNPDELIRQQYAHEDSGGGEPRRAGGERRSSLQRTQTSDGEVVAVSSCCGNLPEVEQATEAGISDVGLYRTELLYLVDKDPPTRDALVRHYQGVVDKAEGGDVTFRLLNVDSGLEVHYMHPVREPNPKLGRAGVRALLNRDDVLRRQLQAILLTEGTGDARIAVPFVTDCGELRRLREILFEERLELRKESVSFRERVEVGVVIETPASVFGMRDFAREADFLLVGIDSLMEHILAADRDRAELASFRQGVHPYVLRALRKLVEVCAENGRDVGVFGARAADPTCATLLLGTGLRSFCVPPEDARDFVSFVERLDSHEAGETATQVAQKASASESQSVVSSYHHGYAGPPGA